MKKKIKVTLYGPHGSGKTTIIRFFDKYLLDMDVQTVNGPTTIGFDLGQIIVNRVSGEIAPLKERRAGEDDIVVYLYGAPGQIRFSAMRRHLLKDTDGILFVLDATNPGHVSHAVALYEETKIFMKREVPIVILANKQDLPGAMKKEQISVLLKTDHDIVETSALLGWNLKEALTMLLSKIEKEGMRENEMALQTSSR